MKECKTVGITIRVTPEFKALVKRLAEGERRSVTAYIEWLVMKEHKK